ncbi:MAG TPA: squalene synthase HpnC [Paucimonas sp.]|nr:squalene synthase HpnC [Paucimonas sp.]
MSIDHYENFPVASILLPARLRPAVEAIYRFARSADDLADEGDASPPARIAALNAYEAALARIEHGDATAEPLWRDLAAVIEQYRLPLRPFRDLLSAFKQDVAVARYDSFDALLDYCRRSANPIGFLMLHLYGMADERNLRDSDAICSALQLINFWQDVAIDWQKERVYLPREDLARFGVTEEELAQGKLSAAWRDLMRFEVERARAMLRSGAPLALRLPGRVGWELRLVVQGGLRILERIDAVDYDVFRRRPRLTKFDWLLLAWRAMRMKRE